MYTTVVRCMVPPGPTDDAILTDEDVKLENSAAADVWEVGAADEVGCEETTNVLDGTVLVDGGTVTTVVEVIDCEDDEKLVIEDEVGEVDVALVEEELELDCAVVKAEEDTVVVAWVLLEVTVVCGTVVTPVVP